MHITDVVSSVGMFARVWACFCKHSPTLCHHEWQARLCSRPGDGCSQQLQQATPVKRHRLSAVKNTEFLDRLAAQDSLQKFNDDLAMVTSSLRQHRNLMPAVKALVCNYLTNMKGEFPRCVRTFGDIPVKDPTQ